jgi:gentisate 1,2-dioxygenase
MWVFVEEEAFIARAGDFFRVPANAVHWAFNRSDEPVTSFQVHAPALEPERAAAHGLFAEDEQPTVRGNSRNIAVDDEKYRVAEERALAAADAAQVG